MKLSESLSINQFRDKVFSDQKVHQHVNIGAKHNLNQSQMTKIYECKNRLFTYLVRTTLKPTWQYIWGVFSNFLLSQSSLSVFSNTPFQKLMWTAPLCNNKSNILLSIPWFCEHCTMQSANLINGKVTHTAVAETNRHMRLPLTMTKTNCPKDQANIYRIRKGSYCKIEIIQDLDIGITNQCCRAVWIGFLKKNRMPILSF